MISAPVSSSPLPFRPTLAPPTFPAAGLERVARSWPRLQSIEALFVFEDGRLHAIEFGTVAVCDVHLQRGRAVLRCQLQAEKETPDDPLLELLNRRLDFFALQFRRRP